MRRLWLIVAPGSRPQSQREPPPGSSKNRFGTCVGVGPGRKRAAISGGDMPDTCLNCIQRSIASAVPSPGGTAIDFKTARQPGFTLRLDPVITPPAGQVAEWLKAHAWNAC